MATLEEPQTITHAEHARRVDELGKMILAYSEVTEKLQHSHETLTQTVEALKEELGEKNRMLERSNRLAALGEMAAGLAHEIRNPMGGIQLYAGILRGDLKDMPQSLEIVDKISRGVKRVEALVSQVLSLSGDIRIAKQPCDLSQIVRDAHEMIRSKPAAETIQFVLDLPAKTPANVDPVLLMQVVANLLDNASEAIAGPGVVIVELDADDAIHMRVRDSGPGIPADVIDRIFNPFFTTKDMGTGLGLSIVHRIIEAHGGTIRVHNAPANAGAIFEISLPL